MQTTTHPTRDEGLPNPINIQRWKPLDFLSFFRPCTCALILTSDLTSLPTTTYRNPCKQIECMHVARQIFGSCYSFWKFEKATTNYFAEPLASNVIAVIGLVNCLSIVARRRFTDGNNAAAVTSTPRYTGPNLLWLPLKIYLRSFVHSQPQSIQVENYESNLRRQSTFCWLHFPSAIAFNIIVDSSFNAKMHMRIV